MGMMWRVCGNVQGRRGMERRTHLLLKTSLGRLEPLHLILILSADPLSECLQLTACLPVLLKLGCRTNTRSFTQLLNQSCTLTYFYFPSPFLLLPSPHSPFLPTHLPSLLSPSPSSDCLIRAKMLISASCKCSCSFSRFSSASLACRDVRRYMYNTMGVENISLSM